MKTFATLSEARKELSNKELRELIQAAKQIAGDFRKNESKLINILQKLNASKAYRVTGYNSLYTFCIEVLKLSEAQSYHYIAIAKKCGEVPELGSAVAAKRITASKARRLCSVLNADNKEEWLELAESCTHRELEKAVRGKDPRAYVPDQAKYITETHLELKLTLSEESFAQLQRVLELLRSSTGQPVSYEEALLQMAEVYLEKKDPIQKAKRAQLRAEKRRGKRTNALSGRQSLVEGARPATADNFAIAKSESPPSRKQLPAELRHALFLRDGGRCRYIHNGQRCTARTFLHFHHILPVALGGEDSLENILTLCSDHHRYVHRDDGVFSNPQKLTQKPSLLELARG